MKETLTVSTGRSSRGGRSEGDKERTKMRERQRRAITTKIFHGLRKHGAYSLPPRADINQVLRELAKEAGWVIEPDGTTYRSSSSSKVANSCPLCGTKTSTTPTPSSSIIIGGDCSTTASPLRVPVPVEEPMASVLPFAAAACGVSINTSTNSVPYFSGGSFADFPMALYTCGGFPGCTDGISSSTTTVTTAISTATPPQPLEARASNQNMPVGSPLHQFQLGGFNF